MAKNVRISDDLYALAQMESKLQDRSIAQQLEHWAKLGLAAASARAAGVLGGGDAAVAMTRQLDQLDVLSGRRSAEYLHFIPRAIAHSSRPVFPTRYQKS